MYNYYDNSLFAHMKKYVGQTVTIFTVSGGASGCGFTGVLLAINPCYVRLMNRQGTPPANPLSETICPDRGHGYGPGGKYDTTPTFVVGSVCDIPIDKIASFCHNAV